MLELIGSTALSAFRKQRLLTKIRQSVPHITDISAEFIHFVDIEQTLSNLSLIHI